MITIRMDVDGEVEVRWPNRDRQTVALGEAYVQRESTLPVAERLPYPLLADVQAALAQVKAGADTAGGGEQARAQAAVRRWRRPAPCWRRRCCVLRGSMLTTSPTWRYGVSRPRAGRVG